MKSRYILEERISEDVFITTFDGLDTVTNGAVEIQIIREELLEATVVEQLINNASTLLQLRNPHVNPLLDFHYEGADFYLIYKKNIPLRPLETVLNDSTIDTQVKWNWIKDLISFFYQTESLNLPHGNISPSTILIDESNQLWIKYYGIIGPLLSHHLEHVSIIDEAPFLAPELVQYGEVSTRSDMFSIGVLIQYIFTGTLAYKMSADIQTLKQSWLAGQIDFPAHSKLPKAVVALVKKCVQIDKEMRFESFAELVKSYQDPESMIVSLEDTRTSETSVTKDIRNELKLKQRRLFKRVSIVSIILITAFAFFILLAQTYQNYFTDIPSLNVPQLVGSSSDAAIEVLTQKGLRGEVVGTRSHPEFPKGIVIESKPPAGRHVKQNRLVRLFVSNGQKQVLLPNFVGRDLSFAQQISDRLEINLEIAEEIYTDVFQSGVIIAQIPSANTFLTPSETIWVSVSKGFPVFMEVQPAATVWSWRTPFLDGKAKINIDFDILPNWEAQEIKIVNENSVGEKVLYLKTHNAAEQKHLSFKVPVSSIIKVYFNDELALEQTVTQNTETETGGEFGQ